MKSIDWSHIGKRLLRDKLQECPLPWKVHTDWSDTIVSANGELVMTCQAWTGYMWVEMAESLEKEWLQERAQFCATHPQDCGEIYDPICACCGGAGAGSRPLRLCICEASTTHAANEQALT